MITEHDATQLADLLSSDAGLKELLAGLSEQGVHEVLMELPQEVIAQLMPAIPASPTDTVASAPPSVIDMALALDPSYRVRPHLEYLSERLTQAVNDVHNGTSRKLMISMPPREGKSRMTSIFLPTWLTIRHPDWKIGLVSHSSTLAVGWGREIRSILEEHGQDWGFTLSKDSGSASDWQTYAKGEVRSRSLGQSLTGLGFKVLILDDVVKDFAEAHSKTKRQATWDWWMANAVTRLEPPSLTVVVGTRWHEDDFIGRLQSPEYDGDLSEWEIIEFPAIAEDHDVLGRKPGEPLLSPLVDETTDEALVRWEGLRVTVGSYVWSALYQQHPAPPEGAIFDVGWWRYWTTDPAQVTDDGKVVYLNPLEDLSDADSTWLDSWDLTFKADETTDFVVGQRWVKKGANRYLIGQQRGRWDFTRQLDKVEAWAQPHSEHGTGRFVHRRLVEDSANGPALIATLRNKLSGIKPIKARGSKENRARAITPEVESGNVFLPHPSMPGYSWVSDYISEFRNFPNDMHDDQVDATSQALLELRDSDGGVLMNQAPAAPTSFGGVLTSRRQPSLSRIRRGF